MSAKEEKPRRRRGKKGRNLSDTSPATTTTTVPKKLNTHKTFDDATTSKFTGSAENNTTLSSSTTYSNSSKFTFHPHQSLLLVLDEDAPYWYDIGQQTKDRNATIYTNQSNSKSKPKPAPAELVALYRNLADQMYQHELKLYQQNNAATSDDKWVENTMKRGTLKDRVAAMSVTASQSPIHKMGAGLDQLLHLATQAKTSSQQQRVNQLAGEALVDLFTETYLPPHRKLYTLSSRPLLECYNSTQTLSPRVLLLWRLEELIKERYSSFLQLLTKWCSTETGGGNSNAEISTIMNMTGSTSELQKIMGIKTAAHLLSQRPEGEESLLSMVVNKIGDPHKKTAAAAGHALRNVLDQHPVMISVVAREVMQLAHRPHLSPKAMYNCIIFLNQLKLGASTQKLASELIQTYFRLFEVAVKQQHQDKEDSKKYKKNKDKSNNNVKDEQTNVLKSRLLSALLTGVNRAHPFLPASESLQDKERIDALYRIAHLTASPGTATQSLTLLYHLAIGVSEDSSSTTPATDQDAEVVISQNPSEKSPSSSSSLRKDRFYRTLYSTLASPTMLCQGGTKHHQTLFFNLLYKSMKRDTKPIRVLAFAKRLLHTVMHASENACGVLTASLFLLSEVARSQPILKQFHNVIVGNHTDSQKEGNGEFDPSKRDPLVAFGDDKDATLLSSNGNENTKTVWEVGMMNHHFHPSVRKFAECFMDNSRGNVIDYSGDPLRDFSLMPFLDRFAYRHPKSRKSTTNKDKKDREDDEEGGEKRQSTTINVMKKRNMLVSTIVPVNDEKFWNGTGKKVAVENEFFQKFFVERARRDAVKGIVRGTGALEDPDADLDGVIEANENKELGITQKLDEDGWETDPEEEEFANQLAEKLMESAGNGKANFDNEDPDMEGWDDLYSDDDDDGDDGEDMDFSKMDGIKRLDEDDDLDDQFSDDDDDDDDDDDLAGDVNDDDAFMDNDDSDDDSNDPIVKTKSQKRKNTDDIDSDESDDDDDGFAAVLANEDDSDDDSDEDEPKGEQSKKGKFQSKIKHKKVKLSTGFEDADQYAAMIDKAWKDRDEVMAEMKSDQKKKAQKSNDTPSGGKKKRKSKKK